MGQKAIHKD